MLLKIEKNKPELVENYSGIQEDVVNIFLNPLFNNDTPKLKWKVIPTSWLESWLLGEKYGLIKTASDIVFIYKLRISSSLNIIWEPLSETCKYNSVELAKQACENALQEEIIASV